MVKSLARYEGHGATQASLTSPNADLFKVILQGASSLQCGAGSIQELIVKASGASTFKGAKLNATEINAEASGASNVKVGASERLSANASGAAKIEYSGSPEVEQSSSGASTIRSAD